MISKEVCFISSILGFSCHLYICKREREWCDGCCSTCSGCVTCIETGVT
jgi:hypothetical protein